MIQTKTAIRINDKTAYISEDEMEKAKQIIQTLKGMTIHSASSLLDVCKEMLLTTTVGSD